jgi:hypothetical protein
MEDTLGNALIETLTSLTIGNLGNSSINTSGNSLTI